MHTLLETDGGVALITGILGLIGTVVGIVLNRQHKALSEVRENAAAAREQVQNSHGTNLRDDVDRVIAGIDRLLHGQHIQAEQIADLRTDVAWERRERIDLAERLTKHLQEARVA